MEDSLIEKESWYEKQKGFISSAAICLLLSLSVTVTYSNVSYSHSHDLSDTSAHDLIHAGVSKQNITPPVLVKNWVTGEPYFEVLDSIYVRALYVYDGSRSSLILSWELVDAGESAVAEVRRHISEDLGIPASHILVNATHNHSAPWTPVYDDHYRGKEKDTWWAIRYMPSQDEDPSFKEWKSRLIEQSVVASREAKARMKPVTTWLGRSDISAFVQNRRPRPASWGVEKSNIPESFNYRHEDWDPRVLGDGMSFGPLDRTMTVLSFRDNSGKNICTLFHLSAHAVSIYPFMDAISGDWPGQAAREINRKLGGESIFLQGTAGDINPWMRGEQAVAEMALGLADQATLAYSYSAQLKMGTLKNNQHQIELPLTRYGKEKLALESLEVEIQVITCGSLAIVALPGEPMTELGMAIRRKSPYPQTLVLGYANGNGVHYVGMPGEKEYGGYETGEKASIGTDLAGQVLVDAAVELLEETFRNK